MEKCIPVTCKTACNAVKGRLPYHWDLNVYRGCSHDCKYCFARYSHKYMEGGGNFSKSVYVKTNIAEALERQLRGLKWDKSVINLGGVTDSYQPAEAEEKMLPDILRLMIKYKNPIIISTKSDLILRDFDLIDELSRLVYVNIASTITTTNEEMCKKLEPGAVSSARRFQMLKEFKKTKASIGLHMMPLVPYLTDGRENLEQMFQWAKEIDVNYLLASKMSLRGETRKVFFDFLREYYPNLITEYQSLFGKNKNWDYSKALNALVGEMRQKYNVSGDYKKGMRQAQEEEVKQLSLFD